ncbi:MAG: EAL domain-containing protein [Pseudomonadota bacterium]
MAYQPIVDLRSRAIFAHEALVRGPEGEGAASVLAQVTEKNRYRFDQACRIKAIETAAGLGLKEAISINFMPNAVYEPRNCIQATLWAADKYDIAPEQIIFEITEGEEITDLDHLKRIVTEYKHQGFRTAIDDFGAGYSGLSLLADLQPDLIKLDMRLIRHIDTDSVRQKILSGMLSVANSLGIVVVAEGIETEGEREALSGLGIELMQGFLFGRPKFRGARTLDSISFEPPIAA